MPRLPIEGSDDEQWGALLNEWLLYDHNADGSHRRDGIFNVLAWGAVADGVTDDSSAIQATLDAAASYGGVVWLPPSENAYRCDNPLVVPGHVTLKGGYGGMRRGMRLWGDSPRGSILHVHTHDDFITMAHNSVIDGVEIYYPDQYTSGAADPYGWTIIIPEHQHGVTIRNICCPNPYHFIHAEADGFLIDSIQGFPLSLGIDLHRVADVARINNVHFNPNCWSDMEASMRDWVQNQAVSLTVLAAEEFMINNFFSYGHLRGIWFNAYPDDPFFPGSYGSINNFGFDSVQEGILIGDRGISNRQGLSLSNGRIIPFSGAELSRTGIKFIDTDPTNGPAVSMTNVSYFSPHLRSIWIDPNSAARISIFGGQSTEYTNEMVLCLSPDAHVRIIGMRSFDGTGPRVNNPGGSDIDDVLPILV